MSAIYAINTNATTVAENSIIPAYINKAPGNSMSWFYNSAIIRRPGYYKISATVTLTAQTAGNVTITMQKNGQNIPGITATETITTANTEVRTLALEGIIRVLCHEGDVVLTLFNDSDDVAITTSNVSISIID